MADIVGLILVAVVLIFLILYALPLLKQKREIQKKKNQTPDETKMSSYVVHQGLGARVRQRLRDRSFGK